MRRILFIGFAWGWFLPGCAGSQSALDAQVSRPRPISLSFAGGGSQSTGRNGAYGTVALHVSLEEPEPPRHARDAPAEEPVVGREEEPGLALAEAASKILPRLARDTIAAALHAAGHSRELNRLGALARRSRNSACLPELRFQFGTRSDNTLRMTPTLAEPGRFAQADSRDLWFETRVNWRLDRLVYSRDELTLERMRNRAGAARQALSERVLARLEDWLRAQLAWKGDPFEASPARQLLAAAHAAAELDVLTAGWFSTHAPQLGRGRLQQEPPPTGPTPRHSAVAPAPQRR